MCTCSSVLASRNPWSSGSSTTLSPSTRCQRTETTSSCCTASPPRGPSPRFFRPSNRKKRNSRSCRPSSAISSLSTSARIGPTWILGRAWHVLGRSDGQSSFDADHDRGASLQVGSSLLRILLEESWEGRALHEGRINSFGLSFPRRVHVCIEEVVGRIKICFLKEHFTPRPFWFTYAQLTNCRFQIIVIFQILKVTIWIEFWYLWLLVSQLKSEK